MKQVAGQIELLAYVKEKTHFRQMESGTGTCVYAIKLNFTTAKM